MKLVLSDIERDEMKRFYESELQSTVKRLQHLKSVLQQLDSDYKVEVVVAGGSTATTKATPSAPARKRKPAKGKRGRKSIWGDFILTTLKENDRPLLYSEIIQAAKIRFNIPDAKMKVLKAAINQSAFRLRTVHKKIDSIGEQGKKEKFLALKTWYTDGGKLKEEYAAKLK